MLKTLRQIASIGIATEAPPQPDEDLRAREHLQVRIRDLLGRALCIRHVDAGSCSCAEQKLVCTAFAQFVAGRKWSAAPRTDASRARYAALFG